MILYELGDVKTDGHTHLFVMNGQGTETFTTQPVSDMTPHTHAIGVVGDEVCWSTSKSGLYEHTHTKIRKKR